MAEGMAADSVHSYESAENAGEAVAGRVASGDVVLVKASRSMGLEVVVDRIVSAL
jgi:UDP-N-acetylmuramyl pentapeptide synthase